MTTVHLLRHARYSLVDRALGGRAPGHSLDAAGRAQAAALARALAGRAVVAVASGPLERARETAAPIAAAHGLDVAVDGAWDELDFGAWSGMAFVELEGRADWAAWNAQRGTAATPAGETMRGVQARALAALLRLGEAHPGGEVVVVSHAEVVRGLLCQVLGMPLGMFWRLEVSPGGRSVLAVKGGDVRVLGVNWPVG